LDLWENKIKNLHENTFRSLVNLEELDVSHNQLEVIPAKLFETNRKLKNLYLDRNKIKEIPVDLFAPLADLEMLSIRENEIEVIHRGTFRNNKKNLALWLRSNKIRAISEGAFDGLTTSSLLVLTGNLCINQFYTRSLNLEVLSRDLTDCYNNYKNMFGDITTPITTQRSTTSTTEHYEETCAETTTATPAKKSFDSDEL
jgi:Leucine-rich repeat (LRR) protein